MCLDHIPKPVEGVNMILEEETFKDFGYYPSDLKPQSAKTILATCDDCGKVRETNKNRYRPLCKSCGAKGERNGNWQGGKIRWICGICGKTFMVNSFRIQNNKKCFCSRKCKNKWQSENFKGENNPSWNGGKVKTICEECGKEFKIYPSLIKDTNYCSSSCSRKAQKFSKHHTKPELIFEQICKKNNLPFKYTGDGSFWIGKLNPDFVDINGKKIVIEIFGDYWHSPLLNQNMKECSTLEYRKRYYKKYKWQSIFLWESDLKREDVEEFVLLQLRKY